MASFIILAYNLKFSFRKYKNSVKKKHKIFKIWINYLKQEIKKSQKKINHEILKLQKIPPVFVFDFLSNNFYL
jgi:hypothetical protein